MMKKWNRVKSFMDYWGISLILESTIMGIAIAAVLVSFFNGVCSVW